MELKGLEISLASQEHPLNFISLVMLKSLSCSFLASTASLTSQWECAKFIFQPLCTEIYSHRSSKFQIRPSRLESVVWLRPKLCLEKEKVEWLEEREGFLKKCPSSLFLFFCVKVSILVRNKLVPHSALYCSHYCASCLSQH